MYLLNRLGFSLQSLAEDLSRYVKVSHFVTRHVIMASRDCYFSSQSEMLQILKEHILFLCRVHYVHTNTIALWDFICAFFILPQEFTHLYFILFNFLVLDPFICI